MFSNGNFKVTNKFVFFMLKIIDIYWNKFLSLLCMTEVIQNINFYVYRFTKAFSLKCFRNRKGLSDFFFLDYESIILSYGILSTSNLFKKNLLWSIFGFFLRLYSGKIFEHIVPNTKCIMYKNRFYRKYLLIVVKVWGIPSYYQ